LYSVLDIGCGNGVNLEFLKKHFPSVHRYAGIDISKEALIATEKCYPWAKFYQLDIQDSVLKDEQYDLVYSYDVIVYTIDWSTSKMILQRYIIFI